MDKINRVIHNCQNKHFSVGAVTTDQLRQGIDIWGIFTLDQSRKSSSWRELYASTELQEVVGSLLSGCIVPLYLDSQVEVMNLGGDIPQYPGNFFGGSKKEKLQELVIRIFDLTEKHNFGIHPIWIPREQNERVIPTHISTNTTIMILVLNQKYFIFWMVYMDHIQSIVSHPMIQHNSRTIIRNSNPKCIGIEYFYVQLGI